MNGKASAWGACLVWLVSAGVSAQSHPCDVVNPTVYREPQGQLSRLRVSWCFAPLDTDGFPITDAIGFSLQINGGSDLDLGIVLPLGAPNAQGLAYYEATPARLTAGVITLKAYTASLGMSAQSVPITLTLLGSPQSPSNPGIVR